MQNINMAKTRIYLGVISIFIIAHIGTGVTSSGVLSIIELRGSKVNYNLSESKRYFIAEMIEIIDKWKQDNNYHAVKEMNEVFERLKIKARAVDNTIMLDGGSVEFVVYIDKYRKQFPIRFTPLDEDMNNIVNNERFNLEIKIFSKWQPLTIDNLFC